MELYCKLVNLLAESFILDQLISAGREGITRDEITQSWEVHCNNHGRLPHVSRSTFSRHINNIRQLGFDVKYDFKNKHYTIPNARQLLRNPIMAKMVGCLRDFHFVDRYRALGQAIQPRQLAEGHEHLFNIGASMEQHHKLRVSYKHFGQKPGLVTLHPYCLREANGRWYLLAYKEDNEYQAKAQTFALDRMQKTTVMRETFTVPSWFSPAEYYKYAYGTWVDESLPVEEITFLASASVSEYLSTLPLHPSQSVPRRQPDGRFLIRLRLRITPDFCNELQRWGSTIEVLTPTSLRVEMKQRFLRSLECYLNDDENGQPKPAE